VKRLAFTGLISLTALTALTALTGCGRLNFAAHFDAPGQSVLITAVATALPATDTQLTADREVTWSTDLGTISGGGVFRSGELAGIATITATSAANPDEVGMVTIEVTQSIAPMAIAMTPSVVTPTGLSNQVHGFYSDRTKAWWYFYADPRPGQLVHTLTSADFATWSTGPTIDTGHEIGDNGGNFSLARRVIADHEVIHLAQSYEFPSRGRTHARAELTASGLVFGAVTNPNAGGQLQSPDGPAVMITEAGAVIDASGYDFTPMTAPLSPCGDGDAELYTAVQPETGTTSFDAMTYDKTVLWCAASRVNSRWLASDGDTLFYLYEDGAQDPQPVNILFHVRRAGVWAPDETTVKTTPPAVFPLNVSFSISDWTALVHDRTLLAMRRRSTGLTEVRYLDLDAPTAFTGSTELPTNRGKLGSGIAMVPYGTGVLAVELTSNDANNFNLLEYCFWDGSSWTPWHPLIAVNAARDAIAGIAGGVSGRPAITWAENDGIVGVALP